LANDLPVVPMEIMIRPLLKSELKNAQPMSAVFETQEGNAENQPTPPIPLDTGTPDDLHNRNFLAQQGLTASPSTVQALGHWNTG
jgi:hypothetical protein